MRLYINVDHVATVRQARKTFEPDPLLAALECMKGGADGITVHLREDRRHIQDADVVNLSESSHIPVLNLELATAPDIVDLALRLRPQQVTFVPEKRQEVTTEGGLDLRSEMAPPIAAAVRAMVDAGIRTSLFVDPNLESISRSKDLGAHAIELHTGEYANNPGEPHTLNELRESANHARELGLAVHAGHGLNYQNVGPVADITVIEELNIGHSIVARSIQTGMATAVREMRSILEAR